MYRFFQGDAMLVDEWNNVQLFALITYPIYWLIRLVHNSNEGIILIFRMAYLVFQAAGVCVVFLQTEAIWLDSYPSGIILFCDNAV